MKGPGGAASTQAKVPGVDGVVAEALGDGVARGELEGDAVEGLPGVMEGTTGL